MAKLGYTHDTAVIAPGGDFEVLAPGPYPVMIVASEMKVTKKGDGKYLELQLQVIEGPAKGRLLWDRLNVMNPNPQAQEISQAKFSSICAAVGVITTDDSEDLHGKPMTAVVTAKPAGLDSNGVHREAQNEVKGYKPLSAADAPAQPRFVTPTQAVGATISTAAPRAAPPVTRPAPGQPAWRQPVKQQ